MKILVIFASLICGNFAATFDLDATKEVANGFGITLPENQDTTKAVKFLKGYIADRSKADGWQPNVVYSKTGLHYVTTVKLSDLGHEMPFIIQKGEPTLELLEANNRLLTVGGVNGRPKPGLVYHATNTPYDSVLAVTLRNAISGLVALGKNNGIKEKLPNIKTNNAIVQVAVSIVQGTYFGQDVGAFLLVGAFVD